MKFSRTLGLVAVFTLSQLTLATATVTPGSLGQVEAAVRFCARVDSNSADRYEELGKKIVAGMPEKDLAEARSSSEYKETFESVTHELERVPIDKAVEGCRVPWQEDKR
jgi:hypothetical protein